MPMSAYLWTSVCAAFFFVAGCSRKAEPQPTTDLFASTCSRCHGPNGEGMPRLGKELTANEFVQSKSDAELVQFLKEGRPTSHPDNTRGVDMPPKGGNPAITDAQLASIVTYMRSLQ